MAKNGKNSNSGKNTTTNKNKNKDKATADKVAKKLGIKAKGKNESYEDFYKRAKKADKSGKVTKNIVVPLEGKKNKKKKWTTKTKKTLPRLKPQKPLPKIKGNHYVAYIKRNSSTNMSNPIVEKKKSVIVDPNIADTVMGNPYSKDTKSNYVEYDTVKPANVMTDKIISNPENSDETTPIDTDYKKLLNPEEKDYNTLTKNVDTDKSKPISRFFVSTDEVLTKEKKTLTTMVDEIHEALMLPTINTSSSFSKLLNTNITKYNRFKLFDPNIPLQRGFGHVFFVRPSCNILTNSNSGPVLLEQLESNDLFSYAWKTAPELLGELCAKNSFNTNNDFMYSLSNFISSFSPSSEYIDTDAYGKTFTGYKIAYGKRAVASKTAGTIELVFNDDRNLHIYQLIRIWVEYIDGVFSGSIFPTNENIFKKILDYVGSIYYILTAEDGETIIFWSKYYGVFPSTIPSDQYAWSEGNIISNPQLSVTFNFSFKEDFVPYSLMEFNYNANIENLGTSDALPTYDSKLGHSSYKWAKTPFIDFTVEDGEAVYKLRYK